MTKPMCRVVFYSIIITTIFGITEAVTGSAYSMFERNVLTVLGFIGIAIIGDK